VRRFQRKPGGGGKTTNHVNNACGGGTGISLYSKELKDTRGQICDTEGGAKEKQDRVKGRTIGKKAVDSKILSPP